jgi:hypothetical protein
VLCVSRTSAIPKENHLSASVERTAHLFSKHRDRLYQSRVVENCLLD